MCGKLGIRTYSVTKQSKHLEYTHPAMEQVRHWTEMAIRAMGVHHRLVCNFDQVWTVYFSHARKILGKMGHAQKLEKPSVEKASGSIKSALNLDEERPDGPREIAVGAPAVLNPQGKLVPVDNARLARTTTTLSWADGALGRAFITVGKGSVYPGNNSNC